MKLHILLVLKSQICFDLFSEKNHKYEFWLSLQYIMFCSLNIEPYWNIVH